MSSEHWYKVCIILACVEMANTVTLSVRWDCSMWYKLLEAAHGVDRYKVVCNKGIIYTWC